MSNIDIVWMRGLRGEILNQQIEEMCNMGKVWPLIWTYFPAQLHIFKTTIKILTSKHTLMIV